jgi:hypothetical protein
VDTTIATAAVALVAPYLSKAAEAAASEAGKAVLKTGEHIYQAIRDKFSTKQDAYADQTLSRLQQDPENEGRQSALVQVLVELAKEDPNFAHEIQQLVQSAKQDGQVNQFMTQVYGNAWVGKITNIGEIRADHVSF